MVAPWGALRTLPVFFEHTGLRSFRFALFRPLSNVLSFSVHFLFMNHPVRVGFSPIFIQFETPYSNHPFTSGVDLFWVE